MQLPSSNRASFGLSVLSQEVVALQTTATQATFAYRIPISSSQFLFFGISGVANFNNLKPDMDYSNDPTILNAAANRFYADANFGLVYAWGGLRVGFALPKLFGQKYFSPQDLVNVRYAQFRNQLYSISYKFQAGNFSLEPYAMYRVTRDLQNWWEGAAVVYFKEMIWLGGSYHSTQGVGLFLGFDVKEKLRVGYSYELPPVNKEFISVNSHEVQLQIRLGKKKVFKWASRYEAKQKAEMAKVTPFSPKIVSDTLTEQTPIIIKEEKSIADPIVTEKREKPLKQQVTVAVILLSKPPVQSTLSPGLYVIAGSFRTKDSAHLLVRKLSNLGYAVTQVGLNAGNNLYYLYVYSSYDLEECRKVLDQLRLKEATRNAWLLKIE